MSGLATRCPACSTIFRVVPDQLRVSDGWVRCGRCAEVFNAAERLVDVDTGAPARTAAAAAALAGGAGMESVADRAPLAAPAAPADFVGRTGSPAALAQPQRPASPAPAGAAAGHRPEPVARPPARDRADFGDGPPLDPPEADSPAAPPSPGLPEPPASPAAPDDASAFPPTDPGARTDATAPDAAAPLPSFVRDADRAARWRTSKARAALAAGAAAAALLLAAQALHAWRSPLAARYAALRPALEGLCSLLGCRVDAPRQIDGLSVEGSGLVRLEKSALYRLNVSLRNRAPTVVALPALELSLTDSQGRLISRRVLRAADFGVNQDTLAAGTELALQATLQAALNAASGGGAEPIAGYTVELFYP